MQMGHLLKVHLELHDTHGFPEDTWIYEHHEHYNYFFYHVRPAGCPWVVAYLGGDHAKEVGKKDKETLATLLQTPLVKRYQCLAKKTFGETFFKDWSSQPHILGSYASHRPGEYPLNNNLNRPVDNKLFFAGEAFAGAYGQTVDSAFNSRPVNGARAGTIFTRLACFEGGKWRTRQVIGDGHVEETQQTRCEVFSFNEL